ncbi:hypothetical protein TESS_TESS_02796 [Tessaracoccus sp. O5.2]
MAHLVGMRKHTPEPVPMPVTIPTVLLQVRADGTVDATIEGHPLLPPEGVGRWRRSSLPQIIDHASSDRTIPVRIEVHEVDQTVFTDIISARPPRQPTPTVETEPEPGPRRGRRALPPQTPRLVEVSGDGFVPGEDVAVAVIVGHTDATGTGHVSALIDLDTLPDSATHEAILLGRISGTLAMRRLP